MYRNERLYVRLSERDLAILDERRDGYTRSAYIRWLITHDATHPHPEPHPEPLDPVEPPIPSPIQPPVPPPNPIETAKAHYHRFIKTDQIYEYRQGTPIYVRRCACGAVDTPVTSKDAF